MLSCYPIFTAIRIINLERATRWYQEKLGLQPRRTGSERWKGNPTLVDLNFGGLDEQFPGAGQETAPVFSRM